MPHGNSAGSGDSPFAPMHALDEKACRTIGAKLGTARGQRRWSHADVADRLLLSIAQVNGLERADASAFHGPAFFAAALRKYAALMAIDCPEAILIPNSPPIVASEPRVESTAPSTSEPNASGSAIPTLWIGVAAVVLLAGASALTLYFGGTPPPATPSSATLPAPPPAPIDRIEPLAESLPPPPPIARAEPQIPAPPLPVVRAEPPLQPPLPAPAPTPPASAESGPALPEAAGDGGAGLVTLARPAWVFVRYGDNSVTERVLKAGQSLALRARPIYLAIGAGEGVTVTLRGQAVDVSPFRNGDEIRIRASELAALAR